MSKQSVVKETIHYTIRQLEDFSGDKAKIYGVILDNNQLSELDNFIVKYENAYPDDVDFIIETLYEISESVGVVHEKFRLDEGGKRRFVWCLPNYDLPNPPLRLFCITYPTDQMIVVGGGRKDAQTWQESPELNRIARIAIAIHDDLEKIKLKDKDDRDFYFSECGQRKVSIHL